MKQSKGFSAVEILLAAVAVVAVGSIIFWRMDAGKSSNDLVPASAAPSLLPEAEIVKEAEAVEFVDKDHDLIPECDTNHTDESKCESVTADHDHDNDGTVDSKDADDDNDGTPDAQDNDENNDGTVDDQSNDADNDGVENDQDQDDNNDGKIDSQEHSGSSGDSQTSDSGSEDNSGSGH